MNHRKASITVSVVDQLGRSLPNRDLTITQKTHDFLFACGAFETKHIVEPSNDDEQKFYMDRYDLWLKLFNSGTLPFYWGQFEPVQGVPMTETLEKMARYLSERGVALKGHPLCWHTQCAPWLLGYSDQEILEFQLNRIRRDVGHFKKWIKSWDVINEVVIMPEFDRYDNGVTRLVKRYGQVDLVKRVFDVARETDPTATLLINDFNTSERYAQLIEECLQAGVEIDAIGIQSHQHQGYWGDRKLEEVLERFSQFNLPLHFTENTFISGELMPPHIVDLNDHQVESWPTTPEGEERQAKDVERFYRRLFEHPLVEAITTWAFQDGAWLKAPAGMVRIDNSTKPAYHTLDRLLNNEWKTAVNATTDKNGVLSFEGYKGEYEVVVNDQRFTIHTDEPISTIIVK